LFLSSLPRPVAPTDGTGVAPEDGTGACPVKFMAMRSEAHFTGIGPADRTGVKLFSISPGPLLHHSILPIGAKPLSSIVH